MLIDTHSHIYSEEFDTDRAEVVERARQAGVGVILLPAIDKESYERQETLATSDTTLFRQMMGLHPSSVTAEYNDDLELVRVKLFGEPKKYVAVGEIGLDLYWDTTYRCQQMTVLEQQIEWAIELDKPVVLHIRNGADLVEANAYQVVFDLLKCKQFSSLRGVMHCFSGSLDDALRAVDMGFMLGIGGVLTYKKSQLPDIVRVVPMDYLVLETDAPYLAPVPYRGKRNETAFVRSVAEKLAWIKGVDLYTVERVTSDNADRMFNIFC